MSRIFSSHGQQEHLEGGGSGCGGGGVGDVQTGEWMTVVTPALLYLTAVLHFDPRQMSDISTCRQTLSSAGDPGDK